MNDTVRMTDKKVLAEAEAMLKEYVPLQAAGYGCQTADLVKVLLAVAAGGGTIESVCAELVAAPEAETIRRHLNEQLRVEELPQLEAACNAALASKLPAKLWHKPVDMAIDFHDRPYYGKRSAEEGLWVRAKAKDGTTRFYRIATVYVLQHNLRFTVALCFVQPQMSTVQVLQRLQERVSRLQLRIRRLLLDRGFAGIEVQRFLQQQGVPALIACPIRGKQGGTRALCRGRRSYRTQHTFRGSKGQSHTAEIAVCRVFTTAKRTSRLRKRATWYLFILIHLDLWPRHIRKLYRRRFGIESSYRDAAKLRGWTTSPNPALRFLLMALGFLLLNLWAALCHTCRRRSRRAAHPCQPKQFQLSRFAHFITHALQIHYGIVTQITVPASSFT